MVFQWLQLSQPQLNTCVKRFIGFSNSLMNSHKSLSEKHWSKFNVNPTASGVDNFYREVESRIRSNIEVPAKNPNEDMAYLQPKPVNLRYNPRIYTGGLLPRLTFTDEFVRLPDHKPRDRWAPHRAHFGQNDYIDIFGDGRLSPEDFYTGPPWVLRMRNEFQRISARLNNPAYMAWMEEFEPSRLHLIEKQHSINKGDQFMIFKSVEMIPYKDYDECKCANSMWNLCFLTDRIKSRLAVGRYRSASLSDMACSRMGPKIQHNKHKTTNQPTINQNYDDEQSSSSLVQLSDQANQKLFVDRQTNDCLDKLSTSASCLTDGQHQWNSVKPILKHKRHINRDQNKKHNHFHNPNQPNSVYLRFEDEQHIHSISKSCRQHQVTKSCQSSSESPYFDIPSVSSCLAIHTDHDGHSPSLPHHESSNSFELGNCYSYESKIVSIPSVDNLNVPTPVLPARSTSLRLTYGDCQSTQHDPHAHCKIPIVKVTDECLKMARQSEFQPRMVQSTFDTQTTISNLNFALEKDHYLSVSPSCNYLEQYSAPLQYASNLLGRMSNKLRNGRLTDVTLLVSNNSASGTDVHIKKIPAHRVILAAASDYFAAMFGNELKESKQEEIWIYNVTPDALENLVNYIYSGHLELRVETVEEVLAAACFLQINEASTTCEQFLIQRLDLANCLPISRLAERHGRTTLESQAKSFVLKHFFEVSHQPEFLNLTMKELIVYLNSDFLYVPNEASVFASCLKWVRHVTINDRTDLLDSSQSKSTLASVLQYVRLNQLPPRLLIDVLEHEQLFRNDLETIHLILSALKYHLCSKNYIFSKMSPVKCRQECKGSHSSPKTSMSSYTKYVAPDNTGTDKEDSRSCELSKNAHSSSNWQIIVNDAVCKGFEPICMGQVKNFYPRPSTVGKIWALGGKTVAPTQALQEMLEYDPYLNQWRVIGDLPGQRQQCGCAILNDGRLLIVGGRDELRTLSTVEAIFLNDIDRLSVKFNTECPPSVVAVPECHCHCNKLANCEFKKCDKWKVVSSMLTHRHGLGVAILEGIIYAVGGHDGWSYLNTVERWNGKANTWSAVSPMAVQRSTVGVAALDGFLYAVGGRDGSSCLRTVERFNPHTQHWCFVSSMLHRRGGVGVGSVNGFLFAVGGHNAPSNHPNAARTSSVEMYDPRTDMWTEVSSLANPRDSIAVVTLGTKLYALGGYDGTSYTNQVEVYNFETDEWSKTAPLPSGRAGLAVASRNFVSDIPDHMKLSYHKVDPLM